LLTAHRGIVLKLAAVYGRCAADRDDLAQDIATELWRGFPKYDPSRPFATWMYRVGLNVAISAMRRVRPDGRALSLDAERDGGGPPLGELLGRVDDDEQREADERVRTLYAVIERQTPLDRALLLLWLDERSHREIAEVLGISETNVATKLSRLRQRLREQHS
jgi:RNA polymerase sigma-70 factor (ECF subfamily)